VLEWSFKSVKLVEFEFVHNLSKPQISHPASLQLNQNDPPLSFFLVFFFFFFFFFLSPVCTSLLWKEKEKKRKEQKKIRILIVRNRGVYIYIYIRFLVCTCLYTFIGKKLDKDVNVRRNVIYYILF